MIVSEPLRVPTYGFFARRKALRFSAWVYDFCSFASQSFGN